MQDGSTNKIVSVEISLAAVVEVMVKVVVEIVVEAAPSTKTIIGQVKYEYSVI